MKPLTQKNDSQFGKEMLIIENTKKFHNVVYGIIMEVLTDLKPHSVYNDKKYIYSINSSSL